MRALVIDDELAARSRLKRLLAVYPQIDIAGEAEDGLQAVSAIESLRPDLVFLDIELPGMSGFDVLRSIQDPKKIPLVIFVTGYDEHALAAFDANALAYLLKPVEPERLAQVVERALRLHDASNLRTVEQANLLKAAAGEPKVLKQIVCRKLDRMLLVPPDQILWFQVDASIVRAKTPADSFWVNHSLNELEQSLPHEQFFRARREVLVNMAKIREIRPYFKSSFLLVMSDPDNTEFTVSERQSPALRKRIPGL